MKFGTGVHLDDTGVGPKNQGHRSKIKVARIKNVIYTMSHNHVYSQYWKHATQLAAIAAPNDVSITQ